MEATMKTFEISYSDGLVEGPFSTVEDAIDHLRMQGLGYVVGHSGDLFDGGSRSLFWAREEDAKNDDGARAAGSIRPVSRETTMNTKAVTVIVDRENNGEEFWEAARSLAERSPTSRVGRLIRALDNAEEVDMTKAESEELLAALSALPGWNDGPEYAPHPVHVLD
jgi:hypothetical protein